MVSFFYAVKSTHIFCRPSCASKPPLEENVEFFDTAQGAIAAGYRPCKYDLIGIGRPLYGEMVMINQSMLHIY